MIWWILTLGAIVLLYLGTKLETGGIAKVAYNAGFRGIDLVTAVAIAYAESSGNTNAVGDQSLAPERGPSIGLWQINIGSKAHPDLAGWNLTDPLTNAQAAFRVYQEAGNSFRPWSTFTSARYQAFLQRANSEVVSA